ncbi:hypothetical protein RTG_02756 [Rhodotorula toruloides ATCC 204091]|uniref:ACT domain-domain containing protein n=1 Tax=Rhodotorula toruloides TaxID=5286 RepID=A0A0K3C6T9_RHOTO|nr:hypothetical protein RTG_02756 [Rhodotorula toruloides ATCC 204091]KAK4335617.1 ACT domain-domain containing protein [Rhodotorula toruloides]PRQ77551.1 ACT domain-domain containing protein [Rhodotorula toruloides]
MAALDLSNPALALSFLPTTLSVIKLDRSEPIATELVAVLTGQADEQAFVSLTRTSEETSIVLPTSLFEHLLPILPDVVMTSGPWVALKVAGPMDFSLSGILNALTTPLKEAQIPIFAMSTWNTDYVLVDEKHKERTKEVLSEAGWKFP